MEGNFASTDARYRGKGLVGKGGARVKANFTTPLCIKSKNKVSVSNHYKFSKHEVETDTFSLQGKIKTQFR